MQIYDCAINERAEMKLERKNVLFSLLPMPEYVEFIFVKQKTVLFSKMVVWRL